MKFCFPDVNAVFDTELDKINTIVIENASLFLSLLTDIQTQIEGRDGKGTLSENDNILRMDKRAELLDRFIPFSLNQKVLLSKMSAVIEKRIVEDDRYLQTMELLATMEAFFY